MLVWLCTMIAPTLFVPNKRKVELGKGRIRLFPGGAPS